MTAAEPPLKLSDSLVGAAVLALPVELREPAVARFQEWLAGLRDLRRDVALKVISGEALLRAEAGDPAAGLYEAAARTVELYDEIRQLETQFDTTSEGTA